MDLEEELRDVMSRSWKYGIPMSIPMSLYICINVPWLTIQFELITKSHHVSMQQAFIIHPALKGNSTNFLLVF